MTTHDDIERFRPWQRRHLAAAEEELGFGKKETHWMWFMFPQVVGLGSSEKDRVFSLKSLADATAFFQDEEYRRNYFSLVELAYPHFARERERGAAILRRTFGSTDAKKLRSSLTIFLEVCPESGEANQTISMAKEMLDELGGRCPRTVTTVAEWREA